MQYSLNDIVRITGCQPIGSPSPQWDIQRTIVPLTDSRSLTMPENTLFFALTTPHGSGLRYIAELYEKGVKTFAVDSIDSIPTADMPDAVFLIGDPIRALQSIAAHHLQTHAAHLQTVAITGSNGKTVVKEWLYQLLSPSTQTVRSPRSYNSQIGVPLSLMLIEPSTQLALIEAGISQPHEMERLQAIIQPQTVVLTNIGSAHQENFSSLLQKTTEKLILAKGAQRLVCSADDETICQAINQCGIDRSRIFYWSMVNAACAANPNLFSKGSMVNGQRSMVNDANLFITDIRTDNRSTTVSYTLTDGLQGSYTIPFIDSASVQNSIICLATAISLGYNHADIAAGMATLEPVAMRLEVKEGQRNLTIINDSYNSDVNSLSIALDFMSRREQCARILILSDILQTGEDKQLLYSKVAEMAVAQHIDLLIAVGTDIQPYLDLFTVPCKHFATTDSLIESRLLDTLHDALVLIKGARAFRFDRITSLLERRVHETILEVNLNAIVDNLNHYRAMMKPDTKIVCMVKANAYGAGSIEVSKTLQEHKVDYLAVAVADEGAALRQAGIRSHIMVMNPEMSALRDLFIHRLEPEVYSFKLLKALINAANREGVTGLPIHIKLDTGMHRLGFNPTDDIPTLISILQRQSAVRPVSVFSHFVGSDGNQFDDFTRQQFQLFDTASRALQQALPGPLLRHICNSAGIERFPAYHLDMVRLGIGLYGINPYDNSTINTISTLKTTILQIRDVSAEDTVGYSRRGELTRPSRIAAIPIGYADGLDRHLGRGRGYCIVKGQRAPYVGNICMDVCMIDVTDIPCHEGDSVEIFGQQLPVTVLSDMLDTIPYEILTSVSDRVKRIYFND